MKIVYVHGIAQAGKKDSLHAEWDAILKAGLDALHLDWPKGAVSVAPFYGDTLAAKAAQADSGDLFGLIRKGSSTAEDRRKLRFYREFLREIAAANNISDQDLVDEEGKPVEKGFLNWRSVNALLRALNRSEKIANKAIETFTREVYYYLSYDFIRVLVDQIVADAIPQSEPCVVVAHSLGTVVSYNILSHRLDSENVREWITLGSPLGMKAVYQGLPSGGGKRIAPEGIPAWYNARDPHDVVALNPILRDDFPGPPDVTNANNVNNGTDNRHGIGGYLNDADVVRRIYAALTA